MAALAPRFKDGCVNVDDLGAVFVNWGDCDNCCDCSGDVDSDCDVDVDDLGIVNVNWNKTCGWQSGQGDTEGQPMTVEELIELLLELASQNPDLEGNIADAIAQLLEEE